MPHFRGILALAFPLLFSIVDTRCEFVASFLVCQLIVVLFEGGTGFQEEIAATNGDGTTLS